MPFLELPTHSLHYRIDGEGGPWIVFCNSLGTDLTMWDAQVQTLAHDFRILRYDRRGHGASTAPPGPFTLADLGADVLALLDANEIGRTHFVGLSIGGLVGQWLGIHASHRFDRIVVAATAAKIGTAETWAQRITQVRARGLDEMVGPTSERWFSPGFRAANKPEVERVLAAFTATVPDAYAGCCAALAGADLRTELARLERPLLAIAGAGDPVTSSADLAFIASSVVDGRAVNLPGRHLVNVESAAAFTGAVRSFLAPRVWP